MYYSITISLIKSSNKSYIRYTCTLSSLSNNNYIICFLVDETGLFYNSNSASISNNAMDEDAREELEQIKKRTLLKNRNIYIK